MDKKSAIGLLIFVILTYGGMIAYQAKINHKPPTPIEEDNWQLDDDWKEDASKDVEAKPETAPIKEGIQITTKTYAEAIQKSVETGRPVLIAFSAEWCHWCKKMDEETFSDDGVKAVLSNYIYVKVDTDKEKAIATKFGIPSLPAYVITNSKEEKLEFINGYMKASNFAAWLNNPKILVVPKNDKKIEPVVPNKKEERKRPFRRISNKAPRANMESSGPDA